MEWDRDLERIREKVTATFSKTPPKHTRVETKVDCHYVQPGSQEHFGQFSNPEMPGYEAK